MISIFHSWYLSVRANLIGGWNFSTLTGIHQPQVHLWNLHLVWCPQMFLDIYYVFYCWWRINMLTFNKNLKQYWVFIPNLENKCDWKGNEAFFVLSCSGRFQNKSTSINLFSWLGLKDWRWQISPFLFISWELPITLFFISKWRQNFSEENPEKVFHDFCAMEISWMHYSLSPFGQKWPKNRLNMHEWNS
jgi:hypothetical protein